MKTLFRKAFAGLSALILLATTPAVLPPAGQALAQTSVSCGVDATRMAPDAEEQAVLDQLNVYRASYGLQPLRFSWALTVAALWKSTDMATQHYFSHDDLTRPWLQHFTACGYTISGAFVGENLAAGHADGAATLQQWKDSPPHNENLLNPRFTAIGIKRTPSSDQYGFYWAMELGSAMDYDLLTGLAGQ